MFHCFYLRPQYVSYAEDLYDFYKGYFLTAVISVVCVRGPISQVSPLVGSATILDAFKTLWLWAITILYLNEYGLDVACYLSPLFHPIDLS